MCSSWLRRRKGQKKERRTLSRDDQLREHSQLHVFLLARESESFSVKEGWCHWCVEKAIKSRVTIDRLAPWFLLWDFCLEIHVYLSWCFVFPDRWPFPYHLLQLRFPNIYLSPQSIFPNLSSVWHGFASQHSKLILLQFLFPNLIYSFTMRLPSLSSSTRAPREVARQFWDLDGGFAKD